MKRNVIVRKIREKGINISDEQLTKLTDEQLDGIYVILYSDDMKQDALNLGNENDKDDENMDMILDEGTYVISFYLKLKFKKREDETEEVFPTRTIKFDGIKSVQDIVEQMSLDYINDNYNASEADIVSITNIEVREEEGRKLLNLRMRHNRLQYKLLDQDVEVNTNEGQCVLDYIITETSKVWPNYTREKLIADLPLEGVLLGYTSDDILSWAKDKKYVSAYALDAFNEVIDCVVAEKHVDLQLVFKVNNDHCYGVYEKDLKLLVSQTKKLDLQKQVFDCSIGSTFNVVENTSDLENYTGSEEIIYVSGTTDLSRYAHDRTLKTGYMLEYGYYRKATLEKMKDPVNGQIIIAAYHYNERKDVADKMYAQHEYIGFKWVNQSWSSLANMMCEIQVCRIPKSVYSPDLLDILENYSIGPYISRFDYKFGCEDKVACFDICKCYTSLLLKNETPYNVFTLFDDMQEFSGNKKDLKPGEYILKDDIWIADKTIKITRAQPLVMIKYLLDSEYISLGDIKYVLYASRALPADMFRGMVMSWMTNFPLSYKNLVNHMIGSWNTRNICSTKVAMTDSWDVALGTKMHYEEQNKDIKLAKVGDIWFLRHEQKEALHEGSSPLWRHIIAMGYIELDRIRREVSGPDTRIVGYNTDSITVLNHRRDFKYIDKNKAVPGEICKEMVKDLRGTLISDLVGTKEYIMDTKPWKKVSKNDMIEGIGGLVYGIPGSNKTSLLKNLGEDDITEGKKSVVLCFTNCAVANCKRNDDYGKGCVDCFTLDSFFSKEASRNSWLERLSKYDVVQMDEASMIPKKWISLLYLGWTKKKFILRLFEDNNQTHAIEDDNLWFDYMESKAVRMMCGQNLCELEYMGCRYDKELEEELMSFLKTEKLGTKLKNKGLFSDNDCDFNIVMHHDKRNEINAAYHKSCLRERYILPVDGLTIFDGIPLISIVNLKAYNIWNSERYHLNKLRDTGSGKCTLTIGKEERIVPLHIINSKNFIYGWADTVYRVQGITIPKRFNIHELEYMSFNHLWTALSRATSINNIGIADHCKSKTFSKEKSSEKGKIFSTRALKPISLTRGYIYRIKDDMHEYIGQTNDPERRFQEHLDNPTSDKMAKWLLQGEKKHEIIESFMISNPEQLNLRERMYISKMDPTKSLNSTLVVQKAIEKEKTVIDVKIHVDKFNIIDDIKKCEIRIRFTENGKQNNKRFLYNKETHDEKLALAEKFKQDLIKKYYK